MALEREKLMPRSHDREEEARAFERTQAFLEVVESDLQDDPIGIMAEKNPRHLDWTRQYLETDLSILDIAKAAGVSKQAVEEAVKRTILRLWNWSSPDLQDLFPLADLGLKKPFTLNTFWKRSSAEGSKSQEIAFLAIQGASAEEICRKLGATSLELGQARYVWRKYGIMVPYILRPTPNYSRLGEEVSECADDERLRELMAGVSYRYYTSNVNRGRNLFISISEAARGLGFNVMDAGKLAAEINKSVPVGIVYGAPIKNGREQGRVHKIYFVRRLDFDRARAVVAGLSGLSESDLDTFDFAQYQS